MPEHAPFVVLLFLGTGFASLLSTIGIAVGLASGKQCLAKWLRPGESYTTALVFDLPVPVRGPRLFVGDPAGIERLVIGHENSSFHMCLRSFGDEGVAGTGRRCGRRAGEHDQGREGLETIIELSRPVDVA